MTLIGPQTCYILRAKYLQLKRFSLDCIKKSSPEYTEEKFQYLNILNKQKSTSNA